MLLINIPFPELSESLYEQKLRHCWDRKVVVFLSSSQIEEMTYKNEITLYTANKVNCVNTTITMIPIYLQYILLS